MKKLLTPILLFCSSLLMAQKTKSILIAFNPLFGKEILQLDSVNYKLSNSNDSISFSTLKFYISSIQFFNKNKKIFEEKNSFHLVNANDSNSFKIKLNVLKNIVFDKVQFNLGIDSATNAKGIKAGDLDPIKGMYWTWHSGYINLKLEGNSNVCKTRNNAFEFHLGGFQYPNNALQKISLETNNLQKIDVDIDVKKFIETVDIATNNLIMTPSTNATKLCKIASAVFSLHKN